MFIYTQYIRAGNKRKKLKKCQVKRQTEKRKESQSRISDKASI